MYVVDLDNRKIRRISAEPTRVMTTLFQDSGGLAASRGLYVAPDESEIFYAAGNVVKRWTRRGGIELYAQGPFGDLGLVVKDHRGRPLVADRGANQVFAVTRPRGQPAQITPVAGNGQTGPAADGRNALETPPLGRARRVARSRGRRRRVLRRHAPGLPGAVRGRRRVARVFLDGARNAHAGEGERFDRPGPKVSELRSISVDGRGNLIGAEIDDGSVWMLRRLRAM